MEFEQNKKQNVNKGTYKLMKNAPGKKVETMPETTKTRLARQQRRKAALAIANENSAAVREHAMKTQAETAAPKRKSNSSFAQARIEQKKSDYEHYCQIPVNISPILNMKIGTETVEWRLFKYSKSHKCVHRNAYTSAVVHYSVRKDGTREPAFIEPKCNCYRERVTDKTVEMDCRNCSRNILQVLKDETFPGDIRRCGHCKMQWYKIISWSRERHLDGPVVLPKQKIKPLTTKTWAEVPKVEAIDLSKAMEDLTVEKMESDKQLGDFIFEYAKNCSAKLYEAVCGIYDWFCKVCWDVVVKTTFQKGWEIVKTVFRDITEHVGARPIQFIYHFVQFIRTESTFERLLLFGIMLAELGLSHLMDRFLLFFGLPNLAPNYMVERVRNENYRRDAFYDAQDDEVMLPIGKDFLESQPSDKQSGFSILENIFQFSVWLPKHGLDLIRSFNSIMTGWKNLHELVNNMLDKLPAWLTKLFTITDPRKRYGVESKTPGNPVYEMVQSYLELLKGENCASPKVYEEFVRLWKVADIYITAEYQANDFVHRLHTHYRVNAAALMKPGTRGSKPIPFVTTIFGGPGKGKSATWPVMFGKVVGGTVEQVREMAYTRNTSSEFFDGYVPEKHKIFLFDDFGHLVDDEATGELMSIVTNADYLPPYASINDPNVGVKGTSFNSPIVILCSNFASFEHCKQIADKVALHRRLGIVINWDKQWQEGNRYAVFRTLTNGEREEILNIATGDNRYTLPEIQDLLAIEYRKHMEAQRNRDDFFNQYMKAPKSNAFLDLYNNAMKSEKQDGIITAMSIVYLTHRLAQMVDREYQGWGDLLLAGLGIVASMMAGYYFLSGTSEKQSGDGHLPKTQTKPIFSRAADKQAGDANDEGVIRTVTNNHVVLVNEEMRYVSGVFVAGRILLTVNHFIASSKSITVHTHRAEQTDIFEFNLSDCRVMKFDNVDLVLVECPLYVNPFKNIVKYFCSEPVLKETEGYVTRRNHFTDLVVHPTIIDKSRTLQIFDKEEIPHEIVCDITYEHKGVAGDCGNLVFARQGGSLKIVGIHESAARHRPTMSFGNTVNCMELSKMLEQFQHVYSVQEEFVYEQVTDKQDGISFNKTMYVGESDLHLTGSQKTDIRPSMLFDKVRAHTTEPSLLKKKNGLDPMTLALTKYGMSTKQFPLDLARQAAESMTEELLALKLPGEDFSKLTVDEALNGIPGEIDSVDLTTSSGYPFSLDPKLRGAKRLVLDGEPGQLKLGKAAQEHYDSWTKLIEQGVVPNDPFLATLKVETRPAEKVAAGKTRVFCAGSLTSFVMNKQYFARFGNFLRRVRGQTFSTVGLNRASREWHEMIMRLKEVGPYGIDGDQSNWDGLFKSYLAMLSHEIIAKVAGFDEETYRITMILFLHAVFAHLRISWRWLDEMVTVIIRILGCMPSGWFLTFYVNSIVNGLIFRISWLELVSAPFNDLKYFREFTREKYAGDDNLLSVADAFLREFNNITISAYLAKYDQKYTPATKKGDLIPFQKIEDCTFLKTVTGRLFDQFVPLFDMDANFNTVNWIRKCNDEFKATESNCNDALRNLFFYGYDTFTHWRKLMLQHLPQLNLIGYRSLEAAYLGYGSIPDPYGTFGFTKNMTKNPAVLYRAVQQAKDANTYRNFPIVVSDKQSGLARQGMESAKIESTLICKVNEYFQKEKQVRRAQDELKALGSNIEQLIEGAQECHKDTLERAWIRVNSCPMSFKLAIDAIRVEDTLAMKQREWDNRHQCDKQSGKAPTAAAAKSTAKEAAPVKAAPQAPVAARKEQPKEKGGKTPSVAVGKPSDLDDSTPKMTSKEGVHLAEQQQTVVSEGSDGGARAMGARADAHLNERDWDLNKMLHRENLVSAFQWSLTDNVGTELAIGAPVTDVPADLLKNDIASSPFLRFVFWRCERIKVRFQLVASRFHQGRALVYFVPSCLPKTQQAALVRGPTWATQLQHNFLDPSNGTVVDMDIPFVFHKGWLDLVFGDSLGQLHFKVLNKLQAATGASTSVEVKVFVSFEGSHFRVPRPGGTTFEKLLLQQRADQLGLTLIEKEEICDKQSGIFSDLGEMVGDLAEDAGKELDDLVETLIPHEITGMVADVLLDKPAMTEYPEPLVHKDAQYMSSSRGVEKLERMTLEPTAQNITTDQFGSKVDEMDIKWLLKKPVFFTTFNWAATQSVGEILFQTIISPMHLIAAAIGAAGVPFEATILGTLANFFTFWRGSINLDFMFCGTAFHEGRVDFCNHPAQLTVPTGYAAAMSQYVNSQTIRNTNNAVRVRIPFHSDVPWKRVWTGETLSDVPTDASIRATDYIIGCFSTRVAVPLKNPNNVANNMDVNVFISAGDDFEFHTLSLYAMRYVMPATQEPTPGRKRREVAVEAKRINTKLQAMLKLKSDKQAGDLNTDNKTDAEAIALGVGDVYTKDLKYAHFGETYSSLREILKRYVHLRFAQQDVAGPQVVDVFAFVPEKFPGLMGILFNSYRLFRGPLNMKLKTIMKQKSPDGASYLTNFNETGYVTTLQQPEFNPVPATVGPLNYAAPSDNADGRQPPLVRFSNNQVAEFQIPFQSIYHSLLTNLVTDVISPYYDNALIQFNQVYGMTVEAGAFDGYHLSTYWDAAFADETRLGCFMGFPPMAKRAHSLWPNTTV